MRVSSLQLRGFRAFEFTKSIELDAINIFVGENNSGKSSIVRSLYLMQQGSIEPIYSDVRVGGKEAEILINLVDVSPSHIWGGGVNTPTLPLTIKLTTEDRRSGGIEMTTQTDSSKAAMPQLPNTEPNNFIVPFLSKRKTSHYGEEVRLQNSTLVSADMGNLSARLSRIANPSFPRYSQYRDTCKEILGFEVTAVPSVNGHLPGIYLPTRDILPITQLGDGVPQIVSLLADLAISDGKLFLMEEPENDLHPKALRALLKLIVESSRTNQFVISTHSNIVLRHLGAEKKSRVYKVGVVHGTVPSAEVTLVDSTPQARLEVLQELGYSLSDFDLWEGWLILEEASAERIIRDYLIPWFVPTLSRVRTLSAGGTSKVEPTFEDFDRLFRFAHLEKIYSGAAWVRVDGDKSGLLAIDRLRARYANSWSPDRFACFSAEAFERYYPLQFRERVESVLSEPNKVLRRTRKKELSDEVRKWLDADPDRGRSSLASAARDVIEALKSIESQLVELRG